ncbi:MAG TPA: sigma 54-interacting transcriptional regulator [Longimicrobiaceae bacterium]|nr:sigma 54-interacting transcriptional regulator [Longimicrobiaceae bacterium]
MIAESESMRKVAAVIERVAPTDASVLLWGETSVGREFVGRTIHERSRRADGPWVTFNGAVLADFLHHEQLFGSAAKAGSPRRPGLLERASGGTLFLNAINEMGLETQAELLRVLQAGRFRPAGAEQDTPLDVRLISASYNPERETAAGGLLRDLHDRLSEVLLELPPLRWRREDIPALAKHFLREAWQAGELCDQPVPRLAPDALQALAEHPWPANLEQLQLTMDYVSFRVAPGTEITAADIVFAP